jgi:hypothetical protein
MKANVKRSTLVAAFVLAVFADMIEVGCSLIFAEGFASPINDALDIAMCGILTAMMGWHLSFLPSLLLKFLPVVDLAPTWTIAVLIASRGHWKEMAGAVPPIIPDQKAKVVDIEASVEKQADAPPKI